MAIAEIRKNMKPQKHFLRTQDCPQDAECTPACRRGEATTKGSQIDARAIWSVEFLRLDMELDFDMHSGTHLLSRVGMTGLSITEILMSESLLCAKLNTINSRSNTPTECSVDLHHL